MPDGSLKSGEELVGGILSVDLGGQNLKLRIAAVEKDPRDTLGEILLYDFRSIGPEGIERPLCNEDPDGRRLGLALAGHSNRDGILTTDDPASFEILCSAGAQAKCVRLGYAPWRRTRDGQPMLSWFNSCVRMFRADYCGNGMGYTRDGTIIEIFDRIGISAAQNSTRIFEAAWGPDGAICVAHTRLSEIINLDQLAKACPRLANHLGPALCDDKDPRGLLFNRSE